MNFRRNSFASAQETLSSLKTSEDLELDGDTDLDFHCNDWFVYTVDRPDGTSTQLLGNRDGSYVLTHSQNPHDQCGLLTPQQHETIEDLFAPEKTVKYRTDRSRLDAPKFGRVPTILRCLMWMTPDQPANLGCWTDSNLSPTARTLFATLDRVVLALSGGRPSLRASSLN